MEGAGSLLQDTREREVEGVKEISRTDAGDT